MKLRDNIGSVHVTAEIEIIEKAYYIGCDNISILLMPAVQFFMNIRQLWLDGVEIHRARRN